MTAVDLLGKPVFGFTQVDRALSLTAGTARRWIDGYNRGRKTYPPVVRDVSTGDELVSWGEFVESRLLAEYRDAGVPMVNLRPVVERLRVELDTPYPLTHAGLFLRPEGRELLMEVQDDLRLDKRLLIVARTGQGVIQWTPRASDFVDSVEWEDDVIRRIRPDSAIPDVVQDPVINFGDPTVRGVRTEIVAELIRAGEPREAIAEMYELPLSGVDAAVRFELSRVA